MDPSSQHFDADNDQNTPGPQYAKSWARSTAIGVQKYFGATKKEYTSMVKKVANECEKLTKDQHVKAYVTDVLTKWMETDQKSIKEACDKPIDKDGVNFRDEDAGKKADGTSTSNAPAAATEAPASAPVCAGKVTGKPVARSVLAANIDTYCVEAEKQGVQDAGSGSLGRPYNADTDEHLWLTMTWPAGSTTKITADACKSAMGLIMNGCDGNDPENPTNLKYGGKVQKGEVEYKIEVFGTPPKEIKAGCDYTYQGVFDEFWIWGAGFGSSDGGKKLREELSGCGAITSYEFKNGGGADGREWTANLQLPLGTKGCVGRAIESAGGPPTKC